MRIGVVFPTSEIGNDAVGIRDFAQAAEALGFAHIALEEHVLGADPNRQGGWRLGPVPGGRPGVTHEFAVHEPFVLCGFLAAVTSRIELSTGVVVLPQRQTALVAKQAAEVAVLCGGRLRLGVGAGWNSVEFEGLGARFKDRGRRLEEQVELLRLLWTRPLVEYRGRWHRVERAGINPPPPSPIPVWLGGASNAALERAARLADGYMPLGVTVEQATKQVLPRLRTKLIEVGRDPDGFGFEALARLAGGGPEEWRASAAAWRAAGATHLSLRLAGSPGDTASRFIDAMRAYREAVEI